MHKNVANIKPTYINGTQQPKRSIFILSGGRSQHAEAQVRRTCQVQVSHW